MNNMDTSWFVQDTPGPQWKNNGDGLWSDALAHWPYHWDLVWLTGM